MINEQGVQDTPEALLSCFFAESERRFSYLQEDGFRFFSGLCYPNNGRQLIVPYIRGDRIKRPFIASARYERDTLAYELLYEEAEHTLSFHAYIDQITRLSLQDFLKAMKRPGIQNLQTHALRNNESLESCLRALSGIFKTNRKQLVDPGLRLIERAIIIREKLMEQNIRDYYRRDMARASSEAAKAFMQRDFRRVIELLRPYERDLSATDRKKLDQARIKIQNP